MIFRFIFSFSLAVLLGCGIVTTRALADSTYGNITTIAGIGIGSFSGDGDPATNAMINGPSGIAVDISGNLFIADYSNLRIRKVDTMGIITTVAGSGGQGYDGDGQTATSAMLGGPYGVSVDLSGNIYIADIWNHRIRKVEYSTNIITTVAGTGVAGFGGDGDAATSAQLNKPYGISVDVSGNVYIADLVNNRIRKVIRTTGIITTIAGSGPGGYDGDGGAATSATLDYPTAVSVDISGNVFIVDTNNQRIRKVDVLSNIISTVTGIGSAGFNGDGGAATSAQIYDPYGVAIDVSGNVYVGDSGNNRIRRIDHVTGIIRTIAGRSAEYGYDGDNKPATSAMLFHPRPVVDASGNVYIADEGNNRIRKLEFHGHTSTPPPPSPDDTNTSPTDNGGGSGNYPPTTPPTSPQPPAHHHSNHKPQHNSNSKTQHNLRANSNGKEKKNVQIDLTLSLGPHGKV